MAKFLWDGVEYPEVEKPTMGETAYAERMLGLESSEFTKTMAVMASIFWAVRRRKPDAITWARVEALDVDDLDDIIVEDDPPPAPAEGEEAADPLGGGSPAKSDSPDARSGRRAAAGSTKSGGRSTSSNSRSTSGGRRTKSTD